VFTLDTRIGTVLNQQLDDRCVSITGRQVDRCDTFVIHGIDVTTFFDEQCYDLNVAHG